jgi:hypothetical protein
VPVPRMVGAQEREHGSHGGRSYAGDWVTTRK